MKQWILAMAIVLGAGRVWADKGIAEVAGTTPNSPIQGTVGFEETPAGLKVSVRLTGLPAGPHAFHIHEFGSCADMGKAAGSHFNPFGAPHGHAVKDGIHQAHAGDLGNVQPDKAGMASIDAVIPGLHLSGSEPSVAGRAVILHEKVDDFSQPLGNAGGRIACGTIVITSH